MPRYGFAILGLLLLAVPVGAQESDLATRIQTQIDTADPVRLRAAIPEIEQFLADSPQIAAASLRNRWLQKFMEARCYPETARLAQLAILADPVDAYAIDACLRQRIRALILDHHPQEALAEAKSLFNVCPMGQSESALLLVAECLNRVYPDDPAHVTRLAAEQRIGLQLSNPSAPPTSPELAAIRANTQPYADCLERLLKDAGPMPPTIPDLWARGNLLLLADRPQEAAPLFQRLVQRVDYGELTAAHDAYARALRAQDHTLARANAFILNLKANAAAAATQSSPRR